MFRRLPGISSTIAVEHYPPTQSSRAGSHFSSLAMQWDYFFFFCPFVSSWLNTDAASVFVSASVGFFDPDRIFPASVDAFEDDCFLGAKLFLAMMILLQVIRLPRRGETETC
ncbi:MAG: hypothetical protein IID44_31805 [Planctomycetes bacterium]|nr:hypothetical protein [Planctomycetota bacterium]